MRKAKKTPEQKVDLRKFVSHEMADLVTCMPTEISDADYTAWSAKVDIFAKKTLPIAPTTPSSQRNTPHYTRYDSPLPHKLPLLCLPRQRENPWTSTASPTQNANTA